MRTILISFLLFSFNVFAGTENLKISPNGIVFSKSAAFSKISVPGFELSKKVGAPEVPVKSWLLVGKPTDIQVRMSITKTLNIQNLKPFPTQPQDCRCETKEKKAFQYNRAAYEQNQPFELSYVGAFRGTPITRLDVYMASYDSSNNSTRFLTDVTVDYSAEEYDLKAGSYTDYLIVATEKYANGTKAFGDWKKSLGYTVYTETVKSATSLDAIAALIRKYYTEKGIDFVILVGDETEIPMYRVSTSGSSDTPSDLQYYTMDGAGDNVADMFSGRIVATSEADVAARLDKAIEYDKKTYKNAMGLEQMIGVASNEGSGPSDNEYILSIEKAFKDAWNISSTHYYQNNADSTADNLTKSFSEGALWMFYLGHGSGTSWPSLQQPYSVSNIPAMSNRDSVKSVIIDVACMNGKLKRGYLGTSFSAVSNENAWGAAGYYGGSVNISWHPPAVMARGIAFEHTKNKYRHLGEALLAGQLYLAANWNDQEDVVDNYEWYHLQGDPGMLIGE